MATLIFKQTSPAELRHVEKIEHVPDDRVDKVVESFELDGAISVAKERVAENDWTVSATFGMPTKRS